VPGIAKYRVDSLVLLAFRGEVVPGAVAGRLGGDDDETTFELSYVDSFPLGPNHAIPARTCTLIRMSFIKPFAPDQNFQKWLTDNAVAVISEDVLPRLNHFLLAIKLANTGRPFLETLRSAGEVDLAFVNLSLDGEVVFSRGTSTLFGGLFGESSSSIPQELPGAFAAELVLLTRAVDLVNHGFHAEAVLVAFAVLDLKVQDFLRSRLPNLAVDEADELLRAIEVRRLSRFLDLLMRVAVGKSALASEQSRTDLKWLNSLRNRLIHDAGSCSLRDAQRAVAIVTQFLSFMNAHGAGLKLPEALDFWSPRDPTP
jgi:hypothetical protein